MKLIFSLAFASILILFGCATSHITHSWKSDIATAKKYEKIIVVCLLKDNDASFREKMENHMVGDLSELGYVAISSIKEYGPKAFENMKEQDALIKLRNSGVDAVVTIVLLDKSKEQYYVRDKPIRTAPYYNIRGDFWGYYSNVYNRINTDGYYVIDTQYFWESNFYDLQTKILLYSVQTKSFNPNSTEVLAHEYGKMIVKDMGEKDIVVKINKN